MADRPGETTGQLDSALETNPQEIEGLETKKVGLEIIKKIRKTHEEASSQNRDWLDIFYELKKASQLTEYGIGAYTREDERVCKNATRTLGENINIIYANLYLPKKQRHALGRDIIAKGTIPPNKTDAIAGLSPEKIAAIGAENIAAIGMHKEKINFFIKYDTEDVQEKSRLVCMRESISLQDKKPQEVKAIAQNLFLEKIKAIGGKNLVPKNMTVEKIETVFDKLTVEQIIAIGGKNLVPKNMTVKKIAYIGDTLTPEEIKNITGKTLANESMTVDGILEYRCLDGVQ